MRKVESWVYGLVKRETDIFFSKTIDHIEFATTLKVFGRVVREESIEVYVPALTTVEQAKLRVIAEAYTELINLGKRIEEEIGLEEN